MLVAEKFAVVLVHNSQGLSDIPFSDVAGLEEVDRVDMSPVLSGAGGSGVV